MTDTSLDTPAPPPAPPRRARISHDSTVAELVPMHLKFLALTLLTLGVYHFWARTHGRRFLWSRTRLLDEPFVYLGRPTELLAGFALALVLVVGPVLALNLWLLPQAEETSDTGLAFVVFILSAGQAVLFPYLIFVGGYAARRYRLSRTAWRGIRGAQVGSAWLYGLKAMLYVVLSSITLAWYYPWQRAKLACYRLNNARFGTQPFACDVRGRHLVSSFAIMWFGIPIAGIVLGVAVTGVFALLPAMGGAEGEPQDLTKYIWILQGLSLLFYAPLGLFLLIYRAHELRYVTAHTSFGEVRFEFTYGVWQYVRFVIGNLLIMLVTLSTGWLYVQRRQMKFWERYLVISGDVDFASLQQAAGGPRTGEGLAELFDIGFDVGF